MNHGDMVLPIDLHITHEAPTAARGSVLRYLGDGEEESAPAQLGHREVVLGAVSTYTLSEDEASSASLRFTGLATACTVTLPAACGPILVENALAAGAVLTFTSGVGSRTSVLSLQKQLLLARGGNVFRILPQGHQDIDLTDLAELSLSADESLAASLRFQGVLAETCAVTVPDVWGPVVVENATTGAYALTLTPETTGTALTVTQGKRVLALSRGGAVVACTPEV